MNEVLHITQISGKFWGNVQQIGKVWSIFTYGSPEMTLTSKMFNMVNVLDKDNRLTQFLNQDKKFKTVFGIFYQMWRKVWNKP